MAELASRAHVGIVLGRSTTEADGIRDYIHLLMGALRGTAVDAELFEWADGAPHDPHGRSGGKDAVAELAAMDVLVLQYNPFSFGRWGFARGLPLFLARLRRKRRRPRIAVMFHETSLTCAAPRGRSWEVGSARSSWRCRPRPTSSCVRSSAGQSGFAGRRSAAPVHHLPVASNLPDARAHRDQARGQLRADADTLVLSCIGLRHPGRLQEHVLAAAREAGTVAGSVLPLNLGPGERSAVHLARNVCLRSTGFLVESELAKHVAASHVFLAPYMDGVSTRRGSVMAALQHGVAVVGTAGHLTDDYSSRRDSCSSNSDRPMAPLAP